MQISNNKQLLINRLGLEPLKPSKMEDNKFINGLRAFKPNDNAPDFVKASVILSPKELIDWMEANSDKRREYKGNYQFRLQLLESKTGTYYFSIDTFEPKTETTKVASNEDDSLPF